MHEGGFLFAFLSFSIHSCPLFQPFFCFRELSIAYFAFHDRNLTQQMTCQTKHIKRRLQASSAATIGMDTTTKRYDELKNDKTRADGSLPRPWYELWTRKFFNAVLACGPLPKHIGFIMDGNRRFAQKKSMEKIVGHTMGFNKLKEVHHILVASRLQTIQTHPMVGTTGSRRSSGVSSWAWRW
jgi:hypothetical protein